MSDPHVPAVDRLPPGFNRLAGSNLAAQSAEQIALAAMPMVAVLTLHADASTASWLQVVLTLPFVLFAGAGFIIFFLATAWLLGREYFELAAMRFRDPHEAKAMRRDNAAIVFTAGLFIAAFVSIPVVNLATPVFAMAFMVHMHKRLSGPRPELIEPARKTRLPLA